MDHMDNFRERFEALERRTQMVEQRLRWWRGIACGLIVLALLTWALPAGTGEQQGLEQRLAALESLLVHFTRQGDEVFITRANLHLVNGQGTTTTTNGLGNLIVGYNALRGIGDIRTGSHNVVVGSKHNFSSFGGLVVGDQNEIRGRFAAVSGGTANTASGHNSSVSGGGGNTASGDDSSVSGGLSNTASGAIASVSGGYANKASEFGASVSGGERNTASGLNAVVSGGAVNTASGDDSSVSGGHNRAAAGEFDWVAGSLFEDF